MPEDEETIRRLILELQVLQGTVETLQSRIGLTNAAINELQIAADTIEGLRKEKEGSSLLAPIGGGSYVKAKVEDSERLIVGIGANIAAEKSVDEAKEGFKTQILRLEEVRNGLKKQMEEALTRLNNTRNQLQILSERSREGKQNV
jgi:prefoldin alpha subunit